MLQIILVCFLFILCCLTLQKTDGQKQYMFKVFDLRYFRIFGVVLFVWFNNHVGKGEWFGIGDDTKVKIQEFENMIRLPETNIDKYLEHQDSGTQINNANANDFFTASWLYSIFGLFWAVCVLCLVLKLIQIQQQQRNPGNRYIGKFDFVFFTICFGVIPATIAMMYTPNQINYYHFQRFVQNYVYLFVFVPQIIINFKQWVYCTAVPLNLIVIDYVIQTCVQLVI